MLNLKSLTITFGQIPKCRIWKHLDLLAQRSWSSRSISCLNWSLKILRGFFFPQWGKLSKQGEQKLWIQKFCCCCCCCCYRLRLWHEHGIFARDDRWCDQKHLLKKWDFVQIILAQASCKSSAVACQWWWLAWLQSPLLEPLRACLPHPTPLPPPAHDAPQKAKLLASVHNLQKKHTTQVYLLQEKIDAQFSSFREPLHPYNFNGILTH